VESGKPQNGNLFDTKAKAKLLYENFIKQHQKEEVSSVSNSLHDILFVKYNVTFWEMWKNKLGGKKHVTTSINGSNDEKKILSKFADYFEGVGKVLHKNFRALIFFLNRLYSGDEVSYTTIDVELVDNFIIKFNLDRSKVTGADRLSIEHQMYFHTIVIVLLTKLFKLS